MRKKKICSKCKRHLPATLEYYPYRKASRDQLQNWCRKCHQERRAGERRARLSPALKLSPAELEELIKKELLFWDNLSLTAAKR